MPQILHTMPIDRLKSACSNVVHISPKLETTPTCVTAEGRSSGTGVVEYYTVVKRVGSSSVKVRSESQKSTHSTFPFT